MKASAPVFRFADARTANWLVAGVPAAARLAQGFAAVRPGEPLALGIAGGGALTPHTVAEIARLAPDPRERVAVSWRRAAEAEAAATRFWRAALGLEGSEP